MRIESLDGTPISYTRAGRGTPIVLVHGALGDGSAWRAVEPYLSEHVTVYIVDRRGRGESGDTLPYAVEREIEDLEAVLDAVKEPAYIFGHSSGAILALRAAIRRPDLRGLIVYEPPLCISGLRARPAASLGDRLQACIAAGDRDAALRTFLHEGPEVSDEDIDRMQGSTSWQRMLALAHTTVYDVGIAAEGGQALAGAEAVQVPTLLLLGSCSPEWVKVDTEILAATLPHGAISLLPGQEHGALWQAPADLAREVRRFCGVAFST